MKRLDYLFLLAFPIFAAAISLAVGASFLISTLLFFGLPALWLSVRAPKKTYRAAVFALLTTPLAVALDYVATKSGAWVVPQSMFMSRLFGIVPWEDVIWSFLAVYAIIMFYSHFFENAKRTLVHQRLNVVWWQWLVIWLVIFAAFFTAPESFAVPYAYLWIGILLFLVPVTGFFSLFPKPFAKAVKTGVYFFVLTILHELTSLQLMQWQFPKDGYFIGWVDLLGYRFPFEELFFIIILAAVSAVVYYEFFDDDRR